MPSTYVDLFGRKFSIGELSLEQKDLLRKALTSFKNKQDWGLFCNKIAYSQNTIRILGGILRNKQYWFTEKVIDMPLYRILEDMERRLGAEQGKMLQEDLTYWDFTENERVLNEVLQ